MILINKLKYTFLFFLCFLLVTQHRLIGQESHPNVLLIMTDQQVWDALGYSGNDMIQTPEMDKLAAQGTYFRNAMVTTPICAAGSNTRYPAPRSACCYPGCRFH